MTESFRDIYREIWTNNYGKGLTLEQMKKLETNGGYADAGWTFVKKIARFFILKEDFEDAKNNAKEYADMGDETMQQSWERSAEERVQALYRYYDELMNDTDYDSSEDVKSFLEEGKLPQKLYTTTMVNTVRQNLETMSNQAINKELNIDELNKISPEKQIEIFKRLFKLNAGPYISSTLLKLTRVAPLIERYNISFNMNSFKNADALDEALTQIQLDTKEREEYRQLLEEFKNYEWESPALFTYEVKKGNPYKATPGRWTVGRIMTEDDLKWEGRLMRHCVGSEEQDHYWRFMQDLNRVYSIRDPQGIPWATIETSDDGETVAEAYGRHDHAIRPHEIQILNKFFEKEFGKEHDWFDRDDENKTGRWNYLPDPDRPDEDDEEEEREPYEVEADMDERMGVYWPDVMKPTDAHQYLQWAKDIQRFGYDPDDDELWEGYTDRDNIETDGDGDPFYYTYGGYYIGEASEGFKDLFKLIKEGINWYTANSEERNIDDAVMNGLGIAIALAAYEKVGYHGGGYSSTKLIGQTIRHFVNKALFDPAVSPVAKEFLKSIARATEQGDSMSELKEYTMEDIVDMGQPGSYSFEDNFSLHGFARPNEEEEKKESYPTEKPQNWTAENYQWYLNRLRNPINQMHGHDVSADFLGKQGITNWDSRWFKEDPELLSAVVEHKRDERFNQDYSKTRGASPNQPSLFEMPVEPTEEEYTKWKNFVNENQDVQNNPWRMDAYIPDLIGFKPHDRLKD
jgi:hypothetical protein